MLTQLEFGLLGQCTDFVPNNLSMKIFNMCNIHPLFFIVFCVSKSNEPLLVFEYFALWSALSFHNLQNSEMNFHGVLLFPMCPHQIPKGLSMFQMCSKRCSQQYLIFYPMYFSYIKTINLVGQREAPLCFYFWGVPNVSKDYFTPKKEKKNNLWAHPLTTIFMVRTNVVWLSSSTHCLHGCWFTLAHPQTNIDTFFFHWVLVPHLTSLQFKILELCQHFQN